MTPLVRLTLEDGRVCYLRRQGDGLSLTPRSVLTDEELATLALHRDALLGLVEMAERVVSPSQTLREDPTPTSVPEPVPVPGPEPTPTRGPIAAPVQTLAPIPAPQFLPLDSSHGGPHA